jgi:hypothetical protein
MRQLLQIMVQQRRRSRAFCSELQWFTVASRNELAWVPRVVGGASFENSLSSPIPYFHLFFQNLILKGVVRTPCDN